MGRGASSVLLTDDHRIVAEADLKGVCGGLCLNSAPPIIAFERPFLLRPEAANGSQFHLPSLRLVEDAR